MNDNLLTYFFPRTADASVIIDDHLGLHIDNFSWLPENLARNVLSYNFHPDWVCYLRILKSLSDLSPHAFKLYMKHLANSQWSFPRKQVISELEEIGSKYGINIMLYIPEEDRWSLKSRLSERTVRLRLTENSVEFCWKAKPCSYFEEIHHKASNLGHLLTATSIIEEMFGCKITRNANGNLVISGSKNRTSDEAAQRVLLHYLKQVGMENLFHYRVGKVKFTKAIMAFDKKISYYAQNAQWTFMAPVGDKKLVPDFKFKTDTVKEPRLSEVQFEEKKKVIEEEFKSLFEKEEERVKEDRNRFKEGLTKYYRSQYYEVMREMMMKKDFEYDKKIKQLKDSEDHILFKPRTRDLFDDALEDLRKVQSAKTRRRREMMDRFFRGEITKEERKKDPGMKELEEKQAYMERLVEAIQSGTGVYNEMRDELRPHGNKGDIDNKLRLMIEKSRKDSDDERTVLLPNDEIDKIKEEIEEAKSKYPKDEAGKKGKTETIRNLTKKLRNEPLVRVERRHKGRHLNFPLPVLDNKGQLEKMKKERLENLERVRKEERVVEKKPVPRRENLELLGDWMDRMIASRDKSELFRQRILTAICAAPLDDKRPDFTEKQKKSFRYLVEKGMMKSMPERIRYTWNKQKSFQNSMEQRNSLVSGAIAIKNLLAESTNHLRRRSGRQVGHEQLFLSNSQALGVGFLLKNKPSLLKYVIPSNLARVFAKHYRNKLDREVGHINRWNNDD